MKYKPGDYLSSKGAVHVEILEAIDGELPIYKISSPATDENKGIMWQTETFFDKIGLKKSTPAFDKFAKIKAGDMLRIQGMQGSPHYRKVLARRDEDVLLSHIPIPNKVVRQHKKLEEQLQELTDAISADSEDTPEVIKDVLQLATKTLAKDEFDIAWNEMITGRNAYDIAGEWYTVHKLALMNWELLSE